MAKESIFRYNLIVKRLKKGPVNFEEMIQYLSYESDLQQEDFVISKRTFQRDLSEILRIYNIEIQFDFKKGKYFIENDGQLELNQRIFEAYETFHALHLTDHFISPQIIFENRKPKGVEHLNSIIQALKKENQIQFKHFSFQSDVETERWVEPIILKEFKDRWYLVAWDLAASAIRSFGIDRISELKVLKKKNQFANQIDIKTYYKDCFGIIKPEDQNPEWIFLRFSKFKGHYIKSFPLHHSQQIVEDNDAGLVIKLYLYPSFDFLMEILSYGKSVKILQPIELAKDLQKHYELALDQYKDLL